MKNEYYLDFHIHSNKSRDNKYGPSINDIIFHSIDLDLRGIAITDHDTVLSNNQINQYQTYNSKSNLLVIPGCEVTTTLGHLIILGLTVNVQPDLPPEIAIKQARQEDVIVIAAHPFDPKYGLGELIFELDLDAIEINGRRPSQWNLNAKSAAKILHLPTVGGSDAHSCVNIGNAVTVFKRNVQSIDDILNEIREKRCYGKRIR
ncbi:MAG: PHP domain-containing protein [Candidatus Heimdallarchaeota archaeon]|nr:PHP domain-containing protein [Candidatus Heimdallarchaeota archaeon]MDH5645577.1 PHP domain-containing protein [Candidatus Heimdallarchaeota archaeon]